jgi:hypothetical protein
MGTDVLADLKRLAEAARPRPMAPRRVGEQIDLINRAIGEIERLRAAEKPKRS